MPGFHSKMSPSSAHRWRRCPGSVQAEEGLPDSVGEEAVQGTCFHEVAAECLEFGIDPWPYIGTMIDCGEDGEREFTREMAEKMMPGLIQIRALADVPGAKMYVEKRVSTAPWVGPDESGTADCFIIDLLNRRIINWDWKWGAGVPVSPEWNDQTILYTLGVWNDYAQHEFEAEVVEKGGNPNDPWEDEIEVVICIEQPRAPGGGGTWTTTMGELLAEGEKIKHDADRTRGPNPPRIPGEKQCQFCKAARHNTCKERATMVLGLMHQKEELLEEDLMLGAPIELPKAISPEARSQIILNKKLIDKFLQQLHDEALEDARNGLPTPGLKRVAGRRPPRKWKDEERARIMLEHDFADEAYTQKLRSPTSVEDELRKAEFELRYSSLVLEGEPAPVLVTETDPRETMPTVEDHWDLLDEPDEPDENESLI